MTKFLCVHQGYELYGSDKVFIQSLRAFPQEDVTVHLSKSGPLVDTIKNYTIVIGNLWVLRLKDIKTRPLSLFREFFQSLRYCKKLVESHDVIYVNTNRVIPYLVLSLFSRKKFIIHIHEIETGILKFMMNLLLRLSRGDLITNSKATAANLPHKNISVVHNGIKDEYQPSTKPASFNLLLIGRLNNWKGQGLALEALARLNRPEIKLRFVGSSFENQPQFQQDLQNLVQKYQLQDQVEFFPFTTDTAHHYQWADLLLVPSTRPEPFGLVAIEGMSWHLPVIAANHGGLPEIVMQGETGILFKPNEVEALAQAIADYDRTRITVHGAKARQRYLDFFQEHHYLQSFKTCLSNLLNA